VLKSKTLGFIGGGNMAEAMIRGLVTTSVIDSKKIFVSDPVNEKLEKLKNDYKISVTKNNIELVKKSDIIILAVKPQSVNEVVDGIKDQVTEKKLLISILAGVPIKSMEELLQNKKVGVIRTMPNTPSLVQSGVTALSPSKNVSKADLKLANEIFEAIGKTVVVPEGHIDAVTGLSGSGPAYIFMIIEALSDAGVKMGLSRQVADVLTIQTMIGSAKLAMESGMHPGELKNMVTSPGGTTISGLHALEEGGLRTTLMNAVEAATKRSVELGRQADKK
jgi:pyrroline-5-carboxylate reductase